MAKRSALYRLWSIGGLLALVAFVAYTAVILKPGEPTPVPRFIVAVGIYFAGLIVLGFFTASSNPDADAAAEGEIPQTMEQTLATLRLPDARAGGGERVRRFNLLAFIPIALIVVLVPVSAYLYVTGRVEGVWEPFGPTGIGIPVAFMPLLAVILVAFVATPFVVARGKKVSNDYLSGVGLKITSLPTVIVVPRVGVDGLAAQTVGSTRFEGSRYGRLVGVEAATTRTTVVVVSACEPFEIVGEGGRLIVEQGPDWVRSAVAHIGDDRRWHKIWVQGSIAGVQVDRRGSGADGEWLLDLWLAEQILEALPAR